tara:strand:- start:340 stop:579 length:240 start_codon:yes stop_codon:yes gene_type:complete
MTEREKTHAIAKKYNCEIIDNGYAVGLWLPDGWIWNHNGEQHIGVTYEPYNRAHKIPFSDQIDKLESFASKGVLEKLTV